MEFWEPGTHIMWRYGAPGLDFAAPMTVVRDDEQALVAWLAMGTPVLKLVREDGRDLRAEPSEAFLVPLRQVEHVRTGRETRSRDHVLDVWVEPDRTVERKDEDELLLAVEHGRYSLEEAEAIRAAADEVEDVISAWAHRSATAGSRSRRTGPGRSRRWRGPGRSTRSFRRKRVSRRSR